MRSSDLREPGPSRAQLGEAPARGRLHELCWSECFVRRVRNGVLVGAGPKATVWVGKAVVGSCLELSGLRSCVAASSEETDVLTLSIQVPGRTYPVVFELSLGRSGIPALEILDSIQAA